MDLANCSMFAKDLSSGVDIFVNDAFYESHKVLSSTVGVTRFCYASIAGFLFEAGLHKLKEAFRTNRSPNVAIIGGGNILEKAAALRYLVSSCDGLVFVGTMAFQMMHALGLPVPGKLIEPGAFEEALNIIHFANLRNTRFLFPKDFWCVNNHRHEQLKLFPSHCIFDDWSPVALGPNSLDEIASFLSKSEKIIWIGPVKFGSSDPVDAATSVLARTLGRLSRQNRDITVIGNVACRAMVRESNSVLDCNLIENASVVWEFLKGRKLPGLMALDRGYPFVVDWYSIYKDPGQPLLVDIGSGNGLFIFRMARRNDMNFLGLESNEKLASRCIDSCRQSIVKNSHFIAANATSTFRSIVSSYPGEVAIVSVQCPNPDFNRPEHRWRMLQRSLVEAISDLLAPGGKVFLQSDIEAVALRMKWQFLQFGKGRLAVHRDDTNCVEDEGGWLKGNPFGVQSDWEEHVLQRGAPMYRLMLCKTTSNL